MIIFENYRAVVCSEFSASVAPQYGVQSSSKAKSILQNLPSQMLLAPENPNLPALIKFMLASSFYFYSNLVNPVYNFYTKATLYRVAHLFCSIVLCALPFFRVPTQPLVFLLSTFSLTKIFLFILFLQSCFLFPSLIS